MMSNDPIPSLGDIRRLGLVVGSLIAGLSVMASGGDPGVVALILGGGLAAYLTWQVKLR